MSNPIARSHASGENAPGGASDIVIVDADLRVCEILWALLQNAGYRPCVAPTAHDAAALIASRVPLALIVDWSLPDRSGLSFLLDVRAEPRTERLPAIMLSARDDVDDCIRALDAGADDFMRKPFSPRELLSRLRVLLRPIPRAQTSTRISVKGLTLDLAAMRVESDADCRESALPLSPFECQLLHFFLTHGHRVYSRREIIGELHGAQAAHHDDRRVDHHVFHLRKALRALGHDAVIETVRGRGYRLTDRIEPQAAQAALHVAAPATALASTAPVATAAAATKPASAAR
ncbi:response regulator [Paraburkholderia sp. SARCC-3016]|jgi:two-component system phosphate regulon response regulator PhoB|uniref:response regulator n=1 Tax=Paraburkholderia sp. SARCC-3016 TaxID=3058611 RepID=UPI002809DB8C|nr:response regulator [Paraburkholderia sp. SARCC-3016]MDQ7980845.1 response regulator [Paraburkholderia sp. SARCC-3016]